MPSGARVRPSATSALRRRHPFSVRASKILFSIKPAVRRKRSKTRGLVGGRRLKSVQRHVFDDAAVEGVRSPRFERNFAGDQGVPLLAQFENAAIALPEVAYAIVSAKEDERQQDEIGRNRPNDRLEHKGGGRKLMQEIRIGCHR